MKKLMSVLLALVLVLAMVPVAASAEDVNSTEAYNALKSAIEAAPADGSETTVTLTGNISGMSTDEIITIAKGQNIRFDMNGYSITVDNGFEGRPFINYGTFVVTGNGKIDSSNSEFGGLGAINNFGVLRIENGTFAGNISADGAGIYNRAGGTLTINGGDFTGTAAINSKGSLIINGGNFHTVSCNQYYDSNHNTHWAYCVISSGELYFYNGTVTGVQGALAINSGYAEVYDGTFTTTPCNHGKNGEYSFYALYIAGEEGEVEAHIYGGNYTAAYRVALLCGNDNTGGDGGIKAQATANIHGGTFVGGPNAQSAMSAGANTGDPAITGGTFTYKDGGGVSHVSDVTQYISDGAALTQNEEGQIITDDSKTIVASIDEVGYTSLQAAIKAAGDGDTVEVYAGTYNLTDTLSITKRVNLVGAGRDKTTIVGPVQYKFSKDQGEADLSISGITFQARENEASVQGLRFRATDPNDGYNLNITVANSAFEGWDFGITMNSHANGYDLTVADCFFANGLYAVSYNNDTTTEGQKANNTLAFSGTNILEDVTFAVQKFNNAPVGTEGVVDNTYATVEDYTAGTPTYKGRVKYVTTADELTSAINGATDPTVVYLANDIDLSDLLTITKPNITIVGNGNTIKYTGAGSVEPLAGGAFITMQGEGDNVTLQNVTIDTDKKVKHGVQFYCVEDGRLDNVTVKGGAWTSVQVNGSTDIVITDCTLNPDPKNGNNPYAYIEYAMGSGVTQVPSMSIENVTGQADGDVPLIYADQGTMTRVKKNDEGLKEETDVTNDQILEVINDNITGATLELVNGVVVGEETPDPVIPGGGTPSEPEEPTWPFEDVTEGDDWFYDAVAYVYENGIMAGTGETVFEPTMELDRAMAAQLFYNLEGKPVVTGDSTFTDVTSGHWAVDAITWAAQNDIVAGIGGGLYDPDSNVTREQFAVMLYKYARFKGYDLTATGDLTQFPDAGSISSWAETALSWANGNGLINGHENGTIDPKGSTIRAQAASIMANFDQNVAK